MARDEFDSAGEYVQVKDLEGQLVLFTPFEHIEEIATSFGAKDAVRADAVVLNEDGSYTEHEEVLIFQGALIAALRRRIKVETTIERDPVSGVVNHFETTTSRRVLGVIAKGEAKKGQSAPYVLEAATDEQKELARAYVAKNPTPAPVKKLVKQTLAVVAGNPSVPQAVAVDLVNQSSIEPTDTVVPEDPFAASSSPDEDPFASDE